MLDIKKLKPNSYLYKNGINYKVVEPAQLVDGRWQLSVMNHEGQESLIYEGDAISYFRKKKVDLPEIKLPYPIVKQILENKDTYLCVGIDNRDLKIDGYSDNGKAFQYQVNEQSEAQYPSLTVKNGQRIEVNGLRLWTFAGDGTHHSEIIPVPYEAEVNGQYLVYCSTNTPQNLVIKVLSIEVTYDMTHNNFSWLLKVKKV